MGNTGLGLSGYTLYEVYESPERQLEVARLMDREFDADFVFPMDDGVIFCDVLGLPLLKTDHDFPSVLENPIKSWEALSALRLPDPYSAKRMATNLESLALIARSFDKPLAISVQGPFTLAVEMVGATDVCRGIIRHPEFIHEVLAFTNRVVRDYSVACVDAGVKLICVSEPSAVILSPEWFEELVGSYLRRLFGHLSAWRVLHVCGNTTHLLPQMLATGAEGLSLDQLVDIPGIAHEVPNDVVLIGNVDPVGVMLEKTPEQISEVVLRMLAAMGSHPNYLFSFGCDLAPDTPPENIRAAMEASRTPLAKLPPHEGGLPEVRSSIREDR